MAGPQTSLHYAANGTPTSTDGFNLADVTSVSQVNALPAGDQALVYLDYTCGDTAAFEAMVAPFIGNPGVYGFYLADEPGPGFASELKAESDYIYSVDPGAETFITLENNSGDTNPSYSYNSANTDIDLFGLDPYPVRQRSSGGVNYAVIDDAVAAAEAEGVALSQIVPVYQGFGVPSGPVSSWGLPTPAEAETIVSTWDTVVPTPAFDFVYSWGVQDGDVALSTDPGLAAVYIAHNAGIPLPPPHQAPLPLPALGSVAMAAAPVSGPPPPPHQTPLPSPVQPAGTLLPAASQTVVAGNLTIIGSGSLTTIVGDGTVPQLMSGLSLDEVSFNPITSETLQFGSGAVMMKFNNPVSLTDYGGSGADFVGANSGNDTFVAGAGSLTGTTGPGANVFDYQTGDELLTIDDFTTRSNTPIVDAPMNGEFVNTSTGPGGPLISLGVFGASVDLAGLGPFTEPEAAF